MVRVNLLPHRQLKRAERQRQFNLLLLAVFVAGAAIVFLGETYITSATDSQTNRNQRLEAAIAKVDKDIEEIKTLKSKINEVLDRKKIVESLQTNRSQAVILLDEVSRKLPEGVFLKSIKQVGSLLTLDGIADTNARIATYVRNFSNSDYLQSPGLVEIKAEIVNGTRRNNFTLNVTQVSQQPEAEPEKKNVQGQAK